MNPFFKVEWINDVKYLVVSTETILYRNQDLARLVVHRQRLNILQIDSRFPFKQRVLDGGH